MVWTLRTMSLTSDPGSYQINCCPYVSITWLLTNRRRVTSVALSPLNWTDLQMTASQGQPPFPRNQTLGLMKNAGKPWKLGEPWTRESDKVENSEGKACLHSENRRRKPVDSSTRRNVSHGQNMSQSCQLIHPSSTCGIEWGKYLVKISALPSNT